MAKLAEPPVSVVDQNVDQHGTRKVAEEYLKYLYSKQGQEIAAKHFYRPRDPAVRAVDQVQRDVGIFFDLAAQPAFIAELTSRQDQAR